jgi:hypothetical protein
MSESKQLTVWHNCPYCPCMFLTSADLQKHLLAFKVTGVAPNAYDHKNRWKNELYKRDHSFLDDY